MVAGRGVATTAASALRLGEECGGGRDGDEQQGCGGDEAVGRELGHGEAGQSGARMPRIWETIEAISWQVKIAQATQQTTAMTSQRQRAVVGCGQP